MRQIPVGEVEGGLVAAALAQLAASLRHEISAGKARQQPIRSQEYERLLELIEGGATYGRGLLSKIGAEPMALKPDWEPIVVVHPSPPGPG